MKFDYIKQGDCLELMRTLPDKSIDMILCDLPYGLTKNKWDSIVPLEPLWGNYNRVIKDKGAIILFSQMPFTVRLVNSNFKMFRYELIWQKNLPTGFLNAKRMPLKSHENICVFYKKLPIYNPQMRKGFKPYETKSKANTKNYDKHYSVVTVSNGDRYPIDVLNFKSDKDKLHPTQKPIALLEYLIRTYTNLGGGSVGQLYG